MICDKRQDLYRKKIRLFIDRLGKDCIVDHRPLTAVFGHSAAPVPFHQRRRLTYRRITEGERWGQTWDSAWFHLRGTVPAAWRGKHVVAQLEFSGEGLVFSSAGVPLQGLTNGSVFGPAGEESARTIYPLFTSPRGGERVDLWVETAANGLFGVSRDPDPPRAAPARHGSYEGKVNRLRMGVFDDVLWHLWLDMDLLFRLMLALPESSTRRARILRGLDEAANRFADTPANAETCRALLAPLLRQPAAASAPRITAVGHAHIDTAWLWPVRETVRKTARTFASQLALIRRYPDYVFGASQPQLYAFVKKTYPALYAKIRDAVKDGRWELQGAMWVEADCNIIGGESMVRQVLHGKNFFRDEFGVDVRNLWLPDVFGYSASMPQLLKRAGVDYFLTQKLSWSQFNQFPHTTFRWRGIDGTEILTHFPPENTYNSILHPEGLCKAETNFREKEVLDEMLCLFGIGDGGGGPKAEQIERGRRQRNLEGVPRVQFGRADAFFDRLARLAPTLPLWSGELYLELHRGTLTTQGRTKRGNRKLEMALRATEYLCACLSPRLYPRKALDGVWKCLLINQFHDIIPGSSIHSVYEQTEREHAAGLASCGELQQAAATRLFRRDAQSLTLVNTLNSSVTQPVVLPEGWHVGLADAQGVAVPVQKEKDGTTVAAVNLLPQGIITLTRSGHASPTVRGSRLVLENSRVRYEFTPDGQLAKAYDKQAAREIIEPGQRGNVLTLYLDRPAAWDAWDIDIYYEDQAMETARSLARASWEAGPVRQTLRFKLGIGESRIEQAVCLAADGLRLDFETRVEWRERHRMLRVAFPVAVAADQATFEIQYGHVRRNTHRNVSWDMARFEVAAQRYADLSDHQYGVALLNDCKYGHKVHENVLDLNLLRSPTTPDPDADQGTHLFTYSLLPHEAPLIASNVMAEAAQLNQPPLVFAGRRSVTAQVPVHVSGPGVSLEVLKRAEKDACCIIRLVETRGCRTDALVRLADSNARLVETDLMEWQSLRTLGKGLIRIPMRPFEICTYKIVAGTHGGRVPPNKRDATPTHPV